jgi:hypothetical protein
MPPSTVKKAFTKLIVRLAMDEIAVVKVHDEVGFRVRFASLHFPHCKHGIDYGNRNCRPENEYANLASPEGSQTIVAATAHIAIRLRGSHKPGPGPVLWVLPPLWVQENSKHNAVTVAKVAAIRPSQTKLERKSRRIGAPIGLNARIHPTDNIEQGIAKRITVTTYIPLIATSASMKPFHVCLTVAGGIEPYKCRRAGPSSGVLFGMLERFPIAWTKFL